MHYPKHTQPQKDFALDFASGEPVDGVALAAELARYAETINQIIGFIKKGFTADGKLQPATMRTVDLTNEFAFTGTASQVEFLFTDGFTADPANDSVRMFVNGLRLNGDLLTLLADRVQFPALAGGEDAVIEVYDAGAGILASLTSQAASLGASLIGLEDSLGSFLAQDVEGALAELKTQVTWVQESIEDVSNFIRADGSVPFAADQSHGGKRITNLGTAIEDDDAVAFSQLKQLSDVFSNLEDVFLGLAGGTMVGPINMNENKIIGLPEPETDSEPARKIDLAQDLAALREEVVLRDGSQKATGDLDMGGKAVVGLASSERDDAAVRRDEVADLVSGAVADSPGIGWGGTAWRGSTPPLVGDCEVCDPFLPSHITQPGIYDFQEFKISEPTTLPSGCTIRVRGDLTIEDVLTISPNHDMSENNGRGGSVFTGIQAQGGGSGAGGRGGPGRSANYGGDYDKYRAVTPRRLASVWQHIFHRSGGKGGSVPQRADGKNGGGSIIFLVEGDVIMTGGTIQVSGGEGSGGPNVYGGAGGGGGAVKIYSLGSFTDGQILANGGAGKGDQPGGETSSDAGAGGGGHVVLMAQTFLGTQNIQAKGGSVHGVGHGSPGEGGYVSFILDTDSNNTRNVDVSKGAHPGSRSVFARGDGVLEQIQVPLPLFTRALIYSDPLHAHLCESLSALGSAVILDADLEA